VGRDHGGYIYILRAHSGTIRSMPSATFFFGCAIFAFFGGMVLRWGARPASRQYRSMVGRKGEKTARAWSAGIRGYGGFVLGLGVLFAALGIWRLNA
jgi:hypothetical protein